MKTTEITCDQCKSDIRTAGMQGSYYIRLSSEQRPYRGGSVAAVIHYPDFKDDHHFCRFNCLALFIEDRKAKRDEQETKQRTQVEARHSGG